MALTVREKEKLSNVKANMKIMGQISILEKDISILEKKIENKQRRLAELINTLDTQSTVNTNSSENSKKENVKPDDPPDLFCEASK